MEQRRDTFKGKIIMDTEDTNWHKYPEEKPIEGGDYLVWREENGFNDLRICPCNKNGEFLYRGIIAWIKIPKCKFAEQNWRWSTELLKEKL